MKALIGLAGLVVVGLLCFCGPEMTDRFYLQFEYPEEGSAPETQKIPEVKEITPGSLVYYPHAKNRPFGKVAEVDPKHEFADGEIAPAVLIRFKTGTETWVRLSLMKTFLIETVDRANGTQ